MFSIKSASIYLKYYDSLKIVTLYKLQLHNAMCDCISKLHDHCTHMAAEQPLTAVKTAGRKDLLLLAIKLQSRHAVCISVMLLFGVHPDCLSYANETNRKDPFKYLKQFEYSFLWSMDMLSVSLHY